MPKKLVQQYGPLLPHLDDVADLLWFSEQAFVVAADEGGAQPKDWGTIEGRVVQLLMLHALNTSYSVRLLTTYAQPTEAYALLRVRLEQAIVFSYLVHAEPEKGLVPYIEDIDRTDYRAFQGLGQDELVRDLVQTLFPKKVEEAKKVAAENESRRDPDFDIETDRLRRKWTDLSVYDMALHRDRAVPEDESLMSRTKLTQLYLGLYRPASIVVHSDTGLLTSNFLTLNPTSGGGKELGPHVGSVLLNLVNLAQIDLLQAYEALYWLGSPGRSKIAALHAELQALVLSAFTGTFRPPA